MSTTKQSEWLKGQTVAQGIVEMIRMDLTRLQDGGTHFPRFIGFTFVQLEEVEM